MNMYEILSYKQDGTSKKAILSLLGSLVLAVSIVSTTSTSFPCKDTLYPEVCQSLIPSSSHAAASTTLGDMFGLSVKFTVNQARSIRSLAYNITQMVQNQKTNLPAALDDCVELLDHSLHQLNKILLDDDDSRATLSPEDIQTWLSAAITHQTICSDTLQSHKHLKETDIIDVELQNNIKHISNSLALHKSIVTNEAKTWKGRKLLSDEFPPWVSTKERKLLEASVVDMQPLAVVSLDGTGTHTSIAEAIAFASLAAGSGRTVIHVTAGTYSESNLKVPLKQSNVLLVGDGMGKTVVTGSKNAGGGSTTFNSATFGVSGDGFMARDITFVNTAGPGHQAVALRVSSDKSVFYRCSIIGYQDTLYTLSNRQFYRETDIYGSVDFIFGNSAVVFQNCNIFPRKTATKNFITAQGRSDPNQNTGISIQKCRISGTSTPTYLGRPWKQYSRTVVMQTYIDGSINSAGWYPWSGSGDTLYYAEYMNTGPGASTSGRVKWGGYHASISSAEASKFTVGSLISGGSWLPSTGVVFDSGL